MENFFDTLSSATEGLFDNIIAFVKDIFGAFEGLLSSEGGEGSSEATE